MLIVQPSGSRSWVLRIQHQGRRRDIGLGPWPVVTLAEAREQALEFRRAIRAGLDPVAERRRERAIPTLAEALEAWIAKEAPGWKGGTEGHTARVTPRLFDLHLAALMPRRVDALTEPEITAALLPVWRDRPETAKKLFDRLRGTLRLARAQGQCGLIDWEMIRAGLPSRRPPKVHRAALALSEVPRFAAFLLAKDTPAARALLFLILTAVRSGEARGAAWAEIDLDAALWTIPAARTKAGRLFEVPLAPAALELLAGAQRARAALHSPSPFCFPGPTTGRPLTDVALAKLLRQAGHAAATVHGFRSAFRTWAAEVAHAPREVAEACLAHAAQGGPVEAAYLRTSLLARRRALMDQWAAFVMGGT